MPVPEETSTDRWRELLMSYPMDTWCHFATDDAPFLIRYQVIGSFIPDGARVIDVGCNSGGFGWRLLQDKPACIVYGVEPNVAYLGDALSRGYRGVCPGLIEDVADDIVRVAPELFTHCVAMAPTDHALDLDLCMRSLLKLLVPGGVMCGEGVHKRGWWGDVARHTNLMHSWDAESMRDFLTRYLDDVWVAECGLPEQANPLWVFWRGVKRQ